MRVTSIYTNEHHAMKKDFMMDKSGREFTQG